ncbi:MAG TPA: hypothetical protein VFJ86_00710 [Usitatibacter sp.]|nr:hypothetical protein [Usitatibacter sp.]
MLTTVILRAIWKKSAPEFKPAPAAAYVPGPTVMTSPSAAFAIALLKLVGLPLHTVTPLTTVVVPQVIAVVVAHEAAGRARKASAARLASPARKVEENSVRAGIERLPGLRILPAIVSAGSGRRQLKILQNW